MPRKREGAVPPGEGQEWQFVGFRSPTYTQTPNELFDWLMARLTGAELKVVLYIVRRTFGFSKDADAISIEQICSGIVTKSGRRLDLGTGLGRSTVTDALRALREKNIIRARQTLAANGADGPTLYSLNIIDDENDAGREPDPRAQPWNEGSARVAPRVHSSGTYRPEEQNLGSNRAEGRVHSAGWGPSSGAASQQKVEQKKDLLVGDDSNSSTYPQPVDTFAKAADEGKDSRRRSSYYSDYVAQAKRAEPLG